MVKLIDFDDGIYQVHVLTTMLHGYVSPFASGQLYHLVASINRTAVRCLAVSSMDFGGPEGRLSREVSEFMRNPQVKVVGHLVESGIVV